MRIALHAVKAAVVGWLLVAAQSASALSYVMMRDELLVDPAHGVVVAEVVGVEPATLAFQDETVYVLSVERSLSPRRAGAFERMSLPGSPPGLPIRHQPYGVPVLEPGDRLLVPFERRLDGTIVPMQLNLGLFFAQSIDGREYYTRVLDPHGDVGKSRNAEFHAARDAVRFERWIRARTRGTVQPVDYLAPGVAPTATKFNRQTNNGRFLRWFEFDADTTVMWRALAAGQTGMATDEFAQLQQALAAWTADSGSRILLGYAGTSANPDSHCGMGVDGLNVVLWNDPFGTIGGSFACPGGGTLATAGPCFSIADMMYNGATYYDILEARLTVQDGAGCAFDGGGGTTGAETLTHEIGHTLGFAHSCESGGCTNGTLADDAVMRWIVHGDGRGAALRADDQAAAAASYLEPGGGDPPIFVDGFENP